jgi:hypothetical protein
MKYRTGCNDELFEIILIHSGDFTGPAYAETFIQNFRENGYKETAR